MPTITEQKKKTGEQFTIPINFFLKDNQPLKKLSKEHQRHISRHIPGASFSAFCESVDRQRRAAAKSALEWAFYRAHIGKTPEPEEGEYFPCSTCFKIAKILGV